MFRPPGLLRSIANLAGISPGDPDGTAASKPERILATAGCFAVQELRSQISVPNPVRLPDTGARLFCGHSINNSLANDDRSYPGLGKRRGGFAAAGCGRGPERATRPAPGRIAGGGGARLANRGLVRARPGPAGRTWPAWSPRCR